ERENVIAAGHEHAALTGRHGLRRRERPDTGVAPASRAAAVPLSSVRVRAVLDQEDAFGATELGDALDVEGDMAADVDDERGSRSMSLRLRLEIGERNAQILAVAVDVLDGAARPRDPHPLPHE